MLRFVSLFMLLCLAAAASANALPANKVKVTAAFKAGSVEAGGLATLRIETDVPADYWIYAPDSPPGGGDPLKFTWSAGTGLEPEGDLRFGESHEKFDPGFKATVRTYQTTAGWFEQDFRVAKQASPGVLAAIGKLSLQICNDRMCMKESHDLVAKLEIVAADADADAAADVVEPVDVAPAVDAGPVAIEAAVEPADAHAGEYVTLVVELTIAEGQHTYAPDSPSGIGIPTTIAFEPNDVQPEGELAFEPGARAVDPFMQKPVLLHTGTVHFRQTFRIPLGAEPGSRTVIGQLKGQACDERLCADFALKFSAPFAIVAGAADPARMTPPAPTANDSVIAQAVTSKPTAIGAKSKLGLGAFLLAAIVAALASLGTPCVFPMIPITVSVFSKDAGGSRSRAVFLAVVYALGIIVTFTTFGVLTAVIAGAQGANAVGANAWVNLVLGGLFVVFGISLLGAFELRLPTFLISGAAELQQKKTGVLSVLLMGFVFTLTSFTCTVAIVGGLLVEAADGSYLRPILGMVAFSATFALPFFLIALFPSALRALPQAGGWMNAVKVTLGFLELAFAFKFLSNVDLSWGLGLLTWPAMLTAWIGIFLAASLYLLGVVKVGYDDPNATIGPARLMVGTTFLWFTLYLASGFVGTHFPSIIEGWLPPRGYGITHLSGSAANEELSFHPTFEAAKAAAIAQKRPLFVDFTGLTCTNCRAMESSVFPQPEIRRQLERYARAQLYVDDPKRADSDWNNEFQIRMTGIAAQPYYLMLDPETEEILGRFEGYAGTETLFDEFKTEITRVADEWDAARRD